MNQIFDHKYISSEIIYVLNIMLKVSWVKMDHFMLFSIFDSSGPLRIPWP